MTVLTVRKAMGLADVATSFSARQARRQLRPSMIIQTAGVLSALKRRQHRQLAEAIEGAVAVIGDSPAPADGTSRRSIRITSISGTSVNRGTRYSDSLPFVM